jgi:hypothetical protein
VRGWLNDFRRRTGCSVSGFVRECVLVRLSGMDVDARIRRVLLEKEARDLLRESRGIRRMQSSILADFVYLRDYADELVKGGFKNPSFLQVRKSILKYPNGEKALEAFEHLFSQRQSIGARLCEVASELYPENRYDEIGSLKAEYREERTRRLRSRSLASDKKFGGEKQ